MSMINKVYRCQINYLFRLILLSQTTGTNTGRRYDNEHTDKTVAPEEPITNRGDRT